MFEHPLKNAYIGEYMPKSWLLWYRPLQSNLNDESWNNNNGTWWGSTGTFENDGTYTWARLTVTGSYRVASRAISTPLTYNSLWITMIWWGKLANTNSWYTLMANSQANNVSCFWIRVSNNNLILNNGTGSDVDASYQLTWNTWYCIWVTVESWVTKLYVNWNLVNTISSWAVGSVTPSWSLWKWYKRGSYSDQWWWDGWIRQCAIYNKVLQDSEMLAYYNRTK